MEKYQGDHDIDVSKIIHLNDDVKNNVISEVMDTVDSGRKRVSHKKLKKFNKLIEFWGEMRQTTIMKSTSRATEIVNKSQGTNQNGLFSSR